MERGEAVIGLLEVCGGKMQCSGEVEECIGGMRG